MSASVLGPKFGSQEKSPRKAQETWDASTHTSSRPTEHIRKHTCPAFSKFITWIDGDLLVSEMCLCCWGSRQFFRATEPNGRVTFLFVCWAAGRWRRQFRGQRSRSVWKRAQERKKGVSGKLVISTLSAKVVSPNDKSHWLVILYPRHTVLLPTKKTWNSTNVFASAKSDWITSIEPAKRHILYTVRGDLKLHREFFVNKPSCLHSLCVS